ncbi:MAG: methyltransferase domain-containing protein [Chloroflexota bacterium]
MRRQAGAPELLDGPLDLRTLESNLRDLARVNRWLGGVDLSWRALEPLLATNRDTPLRMLDVGTGAADIPIDLARRANRPRMRLGIVATDIRAEIVDLAARRVAQSGAQGIEVRLAPADRIDADDRSFDIVHASLVLHHLDPADAAYLMREMARVASQAVIVNDLDRRRIWWLGAWLLAHAATGNRYTRHDAPLSVRRAYRPNELSAMAEAHGLREVARYRSRPGYRYAVVFAPVGDANG